jgi:5'-methylthioadenosine phosphorylase
VTPRPGSEGALGVIAGTGFYALDALDGGREVIVDTAYGAARVTAGAMHGRATYFVSRHGIDHSVPPHMVNYRAIMQSLVDSGVTEILAINVVGGIGPDAGDLVVVDDFIDFTKSRVPTYFDGSTPEGVVHVDMTEPYDRLLRQAWIEAAASCGCRVVDGGVYGAFEGPRFETKAEIRMARTMGVSVVGMTGVPEVVLAVERGIPYSALCLVANPAAGLGSTSITMDEVNAVVSTGAATVMRILDVAARDLAAKPILHGVDAS